VGEGGGRRKRREEEEGRGGGKRRREEEERNTRVLARGCFTNDNVSGGIAPCAVLRVAAPAIKSAAPFQRLKRA